MNDISLKEYLETQVRWLDRHIDAKLGSINDSIDKAESQLNARLATMNEFRESLKDQAGRLASKSEVDMALKVLDDKIRALEMKKAEVEGQFRSTAALVAAATSIIVGVIIFVVTRWLTHS